MSWDEEAVISEREYTFSDEGLSEGKIVGGVNRQHGNGDLANRGKTDKLRTGPRKVLVPSVLTWMKEPHDLLGFLVYPSDVRPFASIAVQTAISEIL